MAQTYGCTPHTPGSISDSEGVSPSLSKYISLVFEERGKLSRHDIFFSLFARHYLCHFPKATMTSQCFSLLLGLNTGTPNHNCFFCYSVFLKLLMRQNTLYSSLKTLLRTLSISTVKNVTVDLGETLWGHQHCRCFEPLLFGKLGQVADGYFDGSEAGNTVLVNSRSDLKEFHHCMELSLWRKMFKKSSFCLQIHRRAKWIK